MSVSGCTKPRAPYQLVNPLYLVPCDYPQYATPEDIPNPQTDEFKHGYAQIQLCAQKGNLDKDKIREKHGR